MECNRLFAYSIADWLSGGFLDLSQEVKSSKVIDCPAGFKTCPRACYAKFVPDDPIMPGCSSDLEQPGSYFSIQAMPIAPSPRWVAMTGPK
ncbi:hypothetical protein Bcoa_0520 [Heyndrickxia coagulans 36D1]|uniref:Uncharacterized protein n=1 Tax=Heyndrickxia coagulans 36D1 TaxID=345219 RepID=G2TQ95_HEYCO|nr:hypothetical protein Bcoa_0520 [Heyndrickxia coagulans 36D1]